MFRSFFCALLLFLSSVAFAQTDTKKHFWIDTDLALDDWFALSYLIQQPGVQIDFITIENDGVNDCVHGLPQLKYFLKLTHHEAIPVSCTIEPAPDSNHLFLPEWRKDAETFYKVKNLAPEKPKGSILNFIQSQLETSSNTTTLLALAPVTQLAKAYQAYPKLLNKKINQVYFSGGNLDKLLLLGKDDRAASWNIFVDPLAFHIFFQHMKPDQVYFVPLQVTHALSNTGFDIYRQLQQWTLRGKMLSPASLFAYRIMKNDHKNLLPDDAITAVLALHPTLCKTNHLSIKSFVGNSKEDLDLKISPDGTPTTFCLKLSKKDFVKTYLQGMLS